MPEFCTDYADRLGVVPEIDIERLVARLKPSYSQQLLCECYELVALFKDDDSTLFKGYNSSGKIKWVKVIEGLV